MRLGLAGSPRLRPAGIPAIAALAVGLLYLREASPSVGGGNTGEFQVMAHLLGIGHPPSYPLYLLLAKLASLLPLPGDVAWRINALTAVLGALSVFLAGLLPLAMWTPSRSATTLPPHVLLASAIAAVATGAMPRLWTLSVEAEVFTLHLCLVLAFWLLLLRWQDDRRDWRLAAAALLTGLGLANHRTFLFFGLAGALFAVQVSPAVLRRPKLLLSAVALCGLGLLPYVYVLRGLVVPVAYFAPTDVHRLDRGETWYVVQGNASAETGGGEVVRALFANQDLLKHRTEWLFQHLGSQLGVFGKPLALAGAVGLLYATRHRARWATAALLGSAGAAVFAMSYAKYPDGDRYLLPLETLLALGLAALLAGAADVLARVFNRFRPAAAVAGGAIGLVLGGYWGLSLGVLADSTNYNRMGYIHHTLANLDGVERNGVVCSWWASSWGLWYAQFVDGVRPDVLVVSKGPDDCLRDVLLQEFGRRAVYLPALTDRMRESDYVFFPNRDLWHAVAKRRPLEPGALLKGPDERIFVFDGRLRYWVPSMEAFTVRGFSWDAVQLTPEYILSTIPEGPPLK